MSMIHRPFRGWDAENKCWRYGWYTRLINGARKYHAIVCDEDGSLTSYYIHDPATIGQSTGIDDVNGRTLYEGDIVMKRITMDVEERRIIDYNQGMYKLMGGDNNETPLGWTSRMCLRHVGDIYNKEGEQE